MNVINEEEFQDRTQAILRAKQVFIDSGVTNNITIAFGLYQKVLADREREIFVSTQVYGNKPKTIMDKYERAACVDCGKPMMFRTVPLNEENVKTQLVCTACDLVLDSEKTLEDWMKELKVKE